MTPLALKGLKFLRGKPFRFFTDLDNDESVRSLFENYTERRITSLRNRKPPVLRKRDLLGIIPLTPEQTAWLRSNFSGRSSREP